MTVTGLLSVFVFTSFDTASIVIDILRDLIDFSLGVMYFKMIIHFVTTFKLQTIVHKNGSIDIVAIEPNGNEVFKFKLDEE